VTALEAAVGIEKRVGKSGTKISAKLRQTALDFEHVPATAFPK